MSRLSSLTCYAFCLAAGAFLAYFELHTDDTGLEVFLIVLLTSVLGCWHPRHAWQWALLVGPWAPAAELFKPTFGTNSPPLHGAGGLVGIAAVVMLLGLAGSYAGVGLRKAMGHAR